MMALGFIHIPLLRISSSRLMGLLVALSLSCNSYAEQIEFNTDILDVNDRANIDLAQFSRPGIFNAG